MTDTRENNEIPADKFTEEDPLKEDVEKQTKPKRNFCHNCRHVISNITVEPCLLLFVMAAIININATQNLNLEKACRVNLNYSDSICYSLKVQDMESQNEYEKETQKILASAMTFRTYLSATMPCIMALFIGSFSDKTGFRKIFIAVSLIGQILLSSNAMLNVYFLKEIRLEIYVFSDALIEGLSGAWCSCFLACFAYISAITTDKTRTYRLGLVHFCMTVGFPVGMGISGVLLKNYGYYGTYSFTTCLYIINLAYNTFVLKDPPKTKEQEKVRRPLK